MEEILPTKTIIIFFKIKIKEISLQQEETKVK